MTPPSWRSSQRQSPALNRLWPKQPCPSPQPKTFSATPWPTISISRRSRKTLRHPPATAIRLRSRNRNDRLKQWGPHFPPTRKGNPRITSQNQTFRRGPNPLSNRGGPKGRIVSPAPTAVRVPSREVEQIGVTADLGVISNNAARRRITKIARIEFIGRSARRAQSVQNELSGRNGWIVLMVRSFRTARNLARKRHGNRCLRLAPSILPSFRPCRWAI